MPRRKSAVPAQLGRARVHSPDEQQSPPLPPGCSAESCSVCCSPPRRRGFKRPRLPEGPQEGLKATPGVRVVARALPSTWLGGGDRLVLQAPQSSTFWGPVLVVSGGHGQRHASGCHAGPLRRSWDSVLNRPYLPCLTVFPLSPSRSLTSLLSHRVSPLSGTQGGPRSPKPFSTNEKQDKEAPRGFCTQEGPLFPDAP